MSFLFVLESFKFYKLKEEKVVQGLFLIAFLLNFAFGFAPPGDPNLTPFLEKMQSAMNATDPVALRSSMDSLTRANYVFLFAQLGVVLINLYFSYLYAAAYVGERGGEGATLGLRKMLRALPSLLLMGLILLFPALLSSLLFFLPMMILACMFLFAPIFAALEGKGALAAMEASKQLSKTRKLVIFATFAIQIMIFNLPLNLLMGMFERSQALSLAFGAFFSTLFLLMRGRLLGIFYHFLRVQIAGKSIEQFFELEAKDVFK